MSSDGKYLYAIVGSPASLKLSSDFGSAWSDISPSDFTGYPSICASKNFDILFVASHVTTSLKKTYDKGQNWEFIETPAIFYEIDCSDTGQYLFAISR